jgi:hypothetical protein
VAEAPIIDGILITWDERLFYPGKRVVQVKPLPRLGGDTCALGGQRRECLIARAGGGLGS